MKCEYEDCEEIMEGNNFYCDKHMKDVLHEVFGEPQPEADRPMHIPYVRRSKSHTLKSKLIILLVWLLNKMDASVMLNFKLQDNTATGKKNTVYWSNNTLINVRTFKNNGEEFILPRGKFRIG